MSRELIPENKKGKENDLSATAVFDTHEQAANLFNKASARMLAPATWHKLCGSFSAKFELVDEDGKLLNRNAAKGDYIKIDLPGPGPASGQGYDWVKVELVEHVHDDKEEQYSMKVRPASSPLDDNGDTAHFFSDTSSSTFIIHRVNNLVIASYHGRNEQPNISTDKPIDNIRNAAVATAAMTGLSEVQWQALVKAFIS